MSKIKAMSFNLRIRVEADGANFFDNRCPKILEVIKREAPDLIGFQETDDFMTDWLIDNLDEYVVLGFGRTADYTGERTAIAYRKKKFNLYSFSEEWLSPSPATPKSVFVDSDQSGCPRVACYATLIERETGKRFQFVNTHLDHKGRKAQLMEVAQVFSRISASPLPFVLTGDFNAAPDSETVRMILGTNRWFGTVDATEEAGFTFHNFTGKSFAKIDYIFTNLPTDKKESYVVPDDDACGYYYSDHQAVVAFVTI